MLASFLAARTPQVSAHSHRTDRDNLAALPAELRARPIGSVSEGDVLDFLTDQLKIKERSTVARMRTTLSALFTCAMREKYVAARPVRGVEGLRRLNELASGPSQDPRDIPENANDHEIDSKAREKTGSDQLRNRGDEGI